MVRLLLVLLSILLYSCGGGTSVEYRSAKTYVSQQNYDKAESEALKGIQNNPDDALIPYFLALNIYGAPNSPKKNYAKTGEYFSLALEIDNKDQLDQALPEPIPVLNKNNEPIELITIKDAINHYRYMIWAELYNVSVEFIQSSNNDKAIAQLELASLIDSNNPLTYDMLARLFFETQRFTKSIQNANKALDIDNTLTDLLSLKAEISKTQGDNIQAEKYLKQAYDTAIQNNESPDRLTNHMAGLFDILFTNGKKNEALGLSEKLIESDPENVVLYSNAGALYQNILLDEQSKANVILSKIMSLNEQELEDLKLIYQSCLDLAQKSRENFLMCNQLELDEEKSESYYNEAKRLKTIKNELKSYIRKIDKRIDEL